MNRTTLGAISALTLAAYAAAPAQAEEAEITTPELLISAGIEPVPTKEAASSYTIITADEIEKFQYRDVTDALRSVPGLHIVETGARGTLTSVFTRGASSNQTLVMVNGLAVNDPSSPGGAANLASIPLDNVDRIEVVRGPQSALYGSQAIGGVINIITKRGSSEPRSTLRVEGGTLGTLNTYASTGGSFSDTDYFFSLGREATNGNDITPSRLHGGMGDEKDGSELFSASGSVGTRLNENLNASLFVQYSDSETDTDEDGSTAGFVNTYQNYDSIFEMKRLFVSGDISGRFYGNKWRPKLALGYTRQQTDSSDHPDAGGSVNLITTENLGETLTASFDNAVDLHPSHRLTFSVSHTIDKFESNGFRDFNGFVITLDSKADTSNTAVYLADHMTFGERLFATVSTRYDMPEDHDNRFSFTIAPGYYHPETDTRLTFTYGTGFKIPSLYQRFGFDPNNFGNFYIGNPNLKPEKSKGWEAGIEQGFFDGKALAGATWFDTEVEDAVAIVFIGFDSTAVNIEEFKAKGIEAFVEINPLDRLTARIDYTWTIVDADVFTNTMTRRPRHKVGLTTSYEPWSGTVFSANAQWIDPYRDVPRDGFGFYVYPAPYTVVNIAASHKLNDSVKLTAAVNNLLDKQYEPAHGFEAPGIEALAGVTFSF
ncbi:MAG: TonB-dependent receptor [Alphaproteobacteria bacterium]|nr:TonB-dependent receptor [Alphaproteobacteria bacterium]MDX5415464.1 TonB-dependent receptor [Alphaproteobacteria bacterium]MDX5492695.1 TonB-dependent receptor [Alphaproteobacteria bacterium]